jgi:hypothetical protein
MHNLQLLIGFGRYFCVTLVRFATHRFSSQINTLTIKFIQKKKKYNQKKKKKKKIHPKKKSFVRIKLADHTRQRRVFQIVDLSIFNQYILLLFAILVTAIVIIFIAFVERRNSCKNWM